MKKQRFTSISAVLGDAAKVAGAGGGGHSSPPPAPQLPEPTNDIK